MFGRWTTIKSRCENPNFPKFAQYGARGIVVCIEWHDFATYVKDIESLGPQPSTDHTLDRKDNNGSYALWNIRWATRSEQRRNQQRKVKLYTVGESSLSLTEWASKLGINFWTLRERLRRGWSPERAFSR